MLCAHSVWWACSKWAEKGGNGCPNEFSLRNKLGFREFHRCKCNEKPWLLLHTGGFGSGTIRRYHFKQVTTVSSSTGQSWNLDKPESNQHWNSQISISRKSDCLYVESNFDEKSDSHLDCKKQESSTLNDVEWSADQLDAIASLFRGKTPQKPRRQPKERPLPLPMPFKIRPLGLPKSKRAFRLVSPASFSKRSSLSNRFYKNPEFLVSLAKQIRSLPPEDHVSKVLDKWVGVLKKGSLSLTIRELGHMGLPQRALQTFSWVQRRPQLFPDDRVLCATVEILARAGELKTPFGLQSSLRWGNQNALEAVARGFIKAGQYKQARQVLLSARDSFCELDDSIYAKLIAQASKSTRGHNLATKLLEELEMRDNLKLEIQDCTAVMKGCVNLGMHEAVESLFVWWKDSGHKPNVVMYTTVMHSRNCNRKFREALALVWEMEESNCLLDLPAYRVMIRSCSELGDLSRAARFFSRMKDAGFSPTRDIYNHLIKLYSSSGRMMKCRDILKEMQMMGFKPNLENLLHESTNTSENDPSLSLVQTTNFKSTL